MNNSYIRVAIEEAKKAAKQATGQVRKAMGQPNDPDLIRYNRMTADDFDRMTAQFGADQVQGYIKEMETRRMQGGNR